MANEAIPYFEPGHGPLTAQATNAITGKRFVRISGDRLADGSLQVAQIAAAGERVFGVSEYDAAVGRKLGVLVEGVVPVRAGAAIAAGASVTTNAAGEAIPVAGAAGSVQHAEGIVLTGVAAGADAQVRLEKHSVTV